MDVSQVYVRFTETADSSPAAPNCENLHTTWSNPGSDEPWRSSCHGTIIALTSAFLTGVCDCLWVTCGSKSLPSPSPSRVPPKSLRSPTNLRPRWRFEIQSWNTTCRDWLDSGRLPSCKQPCKLQAGMTANHHLFLSILINPLINIAP